MTEDLEVVRFRATERPDLMALAWRLRHQVFCEDLGWQIPSLNGIEMDAFDLQAMHCAVVRRGLVVGCLRALSTADPYLLEQSFAHLLPGPLPKSSAVWEISRFAVMPSVPDRREVGAFLVRAGFICGHDQGARTLIAVTEQGFERFLRSCGLEIKRLTPVFVPSISAVGASRIGVIQCDIGERNMASIGLLPAVA